MTKKFTRVLYTLRVQFYTCKSSDDSVDTGRGELTFCVSDDGNCRETGCFPEGKKVMSYKEESDFGSPVNGAYERQCLF